MLTSLLPGVRQIRAPLAAGFLWLVTLWIFFEASWPNSQDEGVIGSLNRLLVLSEIGQGVVLSFVAYLLGSFSVLLSWSLMWIIRPQRPNGGRILRSLSPQGRLSLAQLASDCREQLEEALVLSGIDVQRVLELSRPEHDRWEKIRSGEDIPEERGPTIHSPPLQARADKDEISDRLLRDIPVVANSQLLGKHPEVYSAVDRGEAEVEFRIALIPGLLALAMCLTITLSPTEPSTGIIPMAIGLIAAGILLFDAAKRRRDVNDLILTLMEHGRITPPSLSRAKSVATAEAARTPASAIKRAGVGAARSMRDSITEVQFFTDRAIRTYLSALGNMSDSGVLGQFQRARMSAEQARAEADRFERLLSTTAPEAVTRRSANEVIESLDRALGLWEGFLPSLTEAGNEESLLQSWTEAPGKEESLLPNGSERITEIERLISQAGERLAEWERGVRNLVERLASETKSNTGTDRAPDGAEANVAGTTN